MIIHFERSGGFAGIIMRTHIDLDALPPDEAEGLMAMIESSGIRNFEPATVNKNTSDQFSYALNIETGDEKRSLLFSEGQITDELKPLIEYLIRKARSRN